jgi:soluble lytic murein transglycosylase-like protein
VIVRLAAVSVSMLIGAAQCEPPMAIDAQPAAVAPEAPPVPGEAGTTVAGRCTQWEDLLAAHAPARGWDVHRMSKLMWVESRCWPEIRSRTSDTGLMQINDINLPFLRNVLGEDVSRWTLTDPVQNVRAAAALCDYWASRRSTCYQPWSRS